MRVRVTRRVKFNPNGYGYGWPLPDGYIPVAIPTRGRGRGRGAHRARGPRREGRGGGRAAGLAASAAVRDNFLGMNERKFAKTELSAVQKVALETWSVLRLAGAIRHGFWANMIVKPFLSVSIISLSS